ncbi:hypothetical protein [Parapedobacter tibetensis]|uniref:hypothetical protein n=1 Tax=Parapedobacter tibetensis TaxID=2972951 RepID=UPI00214D47E8|nr:hypothetical protein [Parapedobacter tibetensis]
MKALASYPVFEADQVLTNTHLNDVVDYLEQQGRLSRIRLVGSGVVCGLEITAREDGIAISAGCGITSQGYLIQHCDEVYTHYAAYHPPLQPDDLQLISECHAQTEGSVPYYGAKKGVLELLATEAKVAGKKAISGINKEDYVVVLFVEATQVKLKNCDTNDCNDKGSRMDFVVKPLLVAKASFPDETPISFKPLSLKRYNVPSDALASPEDVLDGFYTIVDDLTLDNLAENLKLSWQRYAEMLDLSSANPFVKLNLKAIRDRFNYKRGNFHYIQYFFDFIDDLLKAFTEFSCKVRELSSECCPNELDFPLHLPLGLASATTRMSHRDVYRKYFVGVPVLNGQHAAREEAALLLMRMHMMVQGFDEHLLYDSKTIKITPSYLGNGYLSDRSIPYYYQVKELHHYWDYSRSRYGNAASNLSYHGTVYNDSDAAKEPLHFDIERFDFFRIEGHIGHDYREVLKEITGQRQTYNLPFDLVALNAIDLTDMLQGREITCQINDLQSDYRVLTAGLICQLEQIVDYVSGLKGRRQTTEPGTREEIKPTGKGTLLYADKVGASTLSSVTNRMRKEFVAQQVRQPVSASKPTVETSAKANSVLAAIYVGKQGAEREATAKTETLIDYISTDISKFLVTDLIKFKDLFAALDLLLFLQHLDKLILYLLENDLPTFTEEAYKKHWDLYASTVDKLRKSAAELKDEKLIEFFSEENHAVLFKCTNEKLFALKEEYLERVERYQEAVNFSKYFAKHPGLEHKAGVPKGGTFVVVYGSTDNRVPGSLITNRPSLSDVRGAELVAANTRIGAGGKLDIVATSAPTSRTALVGGSTLSKGEYSAVYKLVKDLNLGKEAVPVIEALQRREMAEVPGKRVPENIVIADFYLPYMCKSNCQPIAYVFQESIPVEPEEPGEPEPGKPSISITPQEFCSNDEQRYPIEARPEGGELTIDGKAVKEHQVIPNTFAVGAHTIEYTLANKETAAIKFTVEEAIDVNYVVKEVQYEPKTMNWSLSFAGSGSRDINKLKSRWLVEGKPVVENNAVLQQILTPNNPKTEITFQLVDGPCGESAFSRIIRIEQSHQVVCGDEREVRIPIKSAADISLVGTLKGIRAEKNVLVVAPAELFAERITNQVIAYYHAVDDGYVFVALNLQKGDASFEATISAPIPDAGETRAILSQERNVTISLKARLTGGTSTWLVNGKPSAAKVSIPAEELARLGKLTISHQIDFGNGPCVTPRVYEDTMERIGKQLEANKGTLVITR